MQREPENRILVTDAQREAHEWKLLTRRLRRMGLNEAAVRLERALNADANPDTAANCTIHRTRPAP
jgi:hypothetical protein